MKEKQTDRQTDRQTATELPTMTLRRRNAARRRGGARRATSARRQSERVTSRVRRAAAVLPVKRATHSGGSKAQRALAQPGGEDDELCATCSTKVISARLFCPMSVSGTG